MCHQLTILVMNKDEVKYKRKCTVKYQKYNKADIHGQLNCEHHVNRLALRFMEKQEPLLRLFHWQEF